MTEALLFFAGASLLAICATTLVVALHTLKTARRYVDLAEERLEHLREGQDRLLALLEQQRRVAEGADVPEEAVQGVREQRAAERGIERSKREILELHGARRHPRTEAKVVSAGPPPMSAPEARERPPEPKPEREPEKKPPKARKAPQLPGFPETRTSGIKDPPQPEEKPRVAVWHPHPDDDVSPGKTLAGREEGSGGSPVRMFHVFYDRYLDNYEGYVKLAERMHRSQANGEVAPDSPAESEWEERLRRVNDGIQRTAARLDIIEQCNPELASDERVSRRASIARVHASIFEGNE